MGQPLRRLADDGGCGLALDWQLRVQEVSFATVHDFLGVHHWLCGPPTTWPFGTSVLSGRTMTGKVIFGNPVAPVFNGRATLER